MTFMASNMQEYLVLIQNVLSPENIAFMVKGAGYSLLIAIGALLIGTILGIIGAAGKISKFKFFRILATMYVELIRGTPMLLQILFIYLGMPTIYTAITGSYIRLNPYLVGLVAMSINSGAYSTELIRSGIEAIDKGQWEACKTLGLSYAQMMRFVILPQAFKRIIPPLVSEFIVLIKDSSLISVIGATELLQSAKIIGTAKYQFIIPLLFASVIYLVMTLTISHFARILERRLAESD